MTTQKPKRHNWQYLPELGPDWEWCPLCCRAREVGKSTLLTYNQAIREVGASRTHDIQTNKTTKEDDNE